MRKPSPLKKLRTEWAGKLKASGFDDLEAFFDPDAPLSNRGKLHPVESTEGAWQQLAERAESGLQWTIWAQGVAHQHKFPNAQQRESWTLYANGASERDIATAMAIPRDRVRALLAAVRKAVKRTEMGNKGGKRRQWKNEKRGRLWRVESKIRDLSVEDLREMLAMTTILASGQSLRS